MSHEPLNALTIDSFLASVERRALRMAQLSLGDNDAALDIVQDSMLKLVQHYQQRPASEWRPLFYRILHNSMNDWHRRQQVRWRVFDRWFAQRDEAFEEDALEQFPATEQQQPEQQLLQELKLEAIEAALAKLSPRQQQAFMLRCWEGMSTAETAAVMACSEGTVKTLYSRALQNMRELLESDHD